VDPESLVEHFNINVIGNILLTQALLPKLATPFSQLLQCGSTLATDARPSLSLQCSTKAALAQFVETIRAEYVAPLPSLTAFSKSSRHSLPTVRTASRNLLCTVHCYHALSSLTLFHYALVSPLAKPLHVEYVVQFRL
jgi:short-subunit dehydrogenase